MLIIRGLTHGSGLILNSLLVILSILPFLILIGVILMESYLLLTNNPKQNIQMVKEQAYQVFAAYPNKQVLANLCTAQAILESGLDGKPSGLAKNYNNLFGIKGRGTAGTINLNTTEYVKGHKEHPDQCFARNKSVKDSIDQYKHLLENGTKDNSKRYAKVLQAKTFGEAAELIREAGYATDPSYTKSLINRYNTWLKPKDTKDIGENHE
jgi:flagellum-specific peptidoglycan hydrolase FlgJ